MRRLDAARASTCDELSSCVVSGGVNLIRLNEAFVAKSGWNLGCYAGRVLLPLRNTHDAPLGVIT